MKFKTKSHFWMVIFIVIVITALITWSVNNFFFYRVTDETTSTFRTVAGIIQRNSYHSPDDVTLQTGSIQGMVSSLNDPDSAYLTADEVQEFEKNFLAEYTGIGIKTTKIISGFMVVEVAEKSPAADNGIKVNDVIVGINTDDVTKSSLTFTELLKKYHNLSNLVVVRAGEEKIINITKATVDFTQTIAQIHGYEDENIMVINLQQFTDKTVSLLDSALKTLNTDDISGVIFDLRNNQGGSVDVAKQILEKTVSNRMPYLFTQNHDQMFAEIEEMSKNANDPKTATITNEKADEFLTAYTSSNKALTIKQPMVILVNEKTASAAEMVAAGLNQIDGVPIIGNTTYGKGTIQEIIPIVNDGSALKLTTKKWFTPTKHNLTIEKALTPTENSIDSFPYTIGTIGAVQEYKNGDRDTITTSTIANVQMVLNYFGYDMHRSDGMFNDETELQLRIFQQENNLTETGIIDAATLFTINEKLITYTADNKNDVTLQKALNIVGRQASEYKSNITEESTNTTLVT